MNFFGFDFNYSLLKTTCMQVISKGRLDCESNSASTASKKQCELNGKQSGYKNNLIFFLLSMKYQLQLFKNK